MRIKITAGGIYGSEGELPIGTELTVENAPAGWDGRYIDLDRLGSANADGDGRDENGDTLEMAQMRKQFEASYERQGTELTDARKKVAELTGEVTDFKAKGDEIASLKSRIVELEGALAERDKEIAALKADRPKPPLKAEHHGGGKFNVTEGETLHLSGLSKADADAFNAMSDEDKAEFVRTEKAKA
jgi:predicted RNase H-like nuclease (RuvC/YqgF family)